MYDNLILKKDYGYERRRSRYEITVTSNLINNSVAMDANIALQQNR